MDECKPLGTGVNLNSRQRRLLLSRITNAAMITPHWWGGADYTWRP